MALGGSPIAGDQIQDHDAPRGQFPLLALGELPNVFVGFTRRGIAMPVEKLSVRQLGVHTAGLRRSLQVIARFGRVALAFHLPGVGGEIVGCLGHANTNANKKNECRYAGFHGGLSSFPVRLANYCTTGNGRSAWTALAQLTPASVRGGAVA